MSLPRCRHHAAVNSSTRARFPNDTLLPSAPSRCRDGSPRLSPPPSPLHPVSYSFLLPALLARTLPALVLSPAALLLRLCLSLAPSASSSSLVHQSWTSRCHTTIRGFKLGVGLVIRMCGGNAAYLGLNLLICCICIPSITLHPDSGFAQEPNAPTVTRDSRTLQCGSTTSRRE